MKGLEIITGISWVIATLLIISFNYLLLFNLQGGLYVIITELFILATGIAVYFWKHKISSIWVSFYSLYATVTGYIAVLFFLREAIFTNCGIYCFAPALVLIQYLLFLPVFSIPLFNILVKERKDSLQWRNNYKIFIIILYLILIPAIYFSF